MRSLLIATLLVSSVAGAASLPFIEDDWPRALAESKKSGKPIFVDSWAPWCHTCRFLRAYVFTDPALAKQAGRFVWLSIDTEKEQNRAFLDGHPVEVWPTLMVLDSRGAPVLRWAGALSVPELEKLLADGERAVAGQDALAQADRLAAAGKPADAAKAYEAALGKVPEASRARVVEALVLAHTREHEVQRCTERAREWAGGAKPKLARDAHFANVAAMGLSCAVEAPKEAAWRAPAVAELTAASISALQIKDLLADDRSGVYETLVEAKKETGDEAGAKKLAGEWLAFLEKEAARATTPDARSAFDPHRVSAALAFGEPARVLPALQASERDLPGDYNPPARQAIVYRALNKLDDALAASDRALAKAYGPRRLRILDVKADVQMKKNDREGARATVEQAIKIAQALPAAQHGPEQVARLQKRLAELR